MKNIIFISAITTLLAACASPTPYQYWHKEGKTRQQANDQLGFCRIDVGAQDLSKDKANKLISYCMKSNGYTIKTGYR